MWKTLLLGLTLSSPGVFAASENERPIVPKAADTAAADPTEGWRVQFQALLNKELMAIGLDPAQLAKEREAILAEPNARIALAQANAFRDRYLSYYETALVQLNFSPEAIREALTDRGDFPNIDGALNIINQGGYRCASSLTLGICNLLYQGQCSLQTIRPGQFNRFASSESTDRYRFFGDAQGRLFMSMHNIDTGDFPAFRPIGAAFASNGAARVCVQARGRLNRLAVTTFLDHYFFSGVFGFSYLMFAVQPSGPPLFDTAIGSSYVAYRSEGLTDALSDFDDGDVFFGEAIPYSPYLVEDMAWITPQSSSQIIHAAYHGAVAQGYAGGSVDSILDFNLEEIHILRVPR